MNEPIFLIGFMGCGKSTTGRRLAHRLGWHFVDTDRLIEEKCGTTIAQIFAQQGEEKFRTAEQSVLTELLRQQRIVVATGGGMPCTHETIAAMNAAGITIYLKTAPEILYLRLQTKHDKRPLIAKKNNEELRSYITETLKQRETFYAQAQLTVTPANDHRFEHINQIINYLYAK